MERRIPKLSADEKSTLVKGISQLSEIEASLIVLHYLQDWPILEVTKKLKLSTTEFSNQPSRRTDGSTSLWRKKFDGI